MTDEELLQHFLETAAKLGFRNFTIWRPAHDPDGGQFADDTVLAVHFARDELTMSRSMLEYLIEHKVHEA